MSLTKSMKWRQASVGRVHRLHRHFGVVFIIEMARLDTGETLAHLLCQQGDTDAQY